MKICIENAIYVEFDEAKQAICAYDLWETENGIERVIYGQFDMARLQHLGLDEAYRTLGEAIATRLDGAGPYIDKLLESYQE